MLGLAWRMGALGLSISEILLVSLESKLGLNMHGNLIKNDPKVGSASWGSWELLGPPG